MTGGEATRRVRAALRSELAARGHAVASDTLGLRSDLYLIGEGDLAKALFVPAASAIEACETMYQGSWVAGLPPRFAVLPLSESESPDLELLEQIGVTVIFCHAEGGDIAFVDLDVALARIGDR